MAYIDLGRIGKFYYILTTKHYHSLFKQISHIGSPFRISLLDGYDVVRIVLLDHIPHNDKSNPDKDNENSFTKYNISLLIPNVDCPSCSLQLLYIMTDKTTSCNIPVCRYNELDTACKGSTDLNTDPCLGAPNGNVCIDSNECFSNCMFNHY